MKHSEISESLRSQTLTLIQSVAHAKDQGVITVQEHDALLPELEAVLHLLENFHISATRPEQEPKP